MPISSRFVVQSTIVLLAVGFLTLLGIVGMKACLLSLMLILIFHTPAAAPSIVRSSMSTDFRQAICSRVAVAKSTTSEPSSCLAHPVALNVVLDLVAVDPITVPHRHAPKPERLAAAVDLADYSAAMASSNVMASPSRGDCPEITRSRSSGAPARPGASAGRWRADSPG